MEDSHARMRVTDGEFDALVEDLVATLNQFKVGKAEQSEVLSLLRPMRGEIVEVKTKETGTPLPAAFEPAAALRR